jgi:MtN3 and saliva related transmembrane protein
MFTTVLAVVTASWGVVMALSPLLQLRKIVAHGSSEGVSIGYFGVLIVGFVLWIAYGADRRDPTLIVPNVVALSVTIAVVVVATRFRRRK